MAMTYFISPDGKGFSSGTNAPNPGGWTEVDESTFDATVAALDAEVQDLITADRDADAADKKDEALAVFNEVDKIHPVLALAVAKLIYPPFEAPKKGK